MAAFQGSLKAIDLASIIRLLAGLEQTGWLHLTQPPWEGRLGFEGGRIVAASFGPEQGLDALDALLLMLPDGHFTFTEGPPPAEPERNLTLGPRELQLHLAELARTRAALAGRISSWSVVPRPAAGALSQEAGEPVALTRSALQVLLRVDGRRTVAEIATGHGPARTLHDLLALHDLGLVQLEAGARAPRAVPGSRNTRRQLQGALLAAAGTAAGGALAVLARRRSGLGTALPGTEPHPGGAMDAVAGGNGASAVGVGGAGTVQSGQSGLPVGTILDEHFATNERRWPDDPQSAAWLAGGAYRLFARRPGDFVAIGVPGLWPLRDVAANATFRKLGGPPGGGYGIIVRDQGPGPRDGLNQVGRFYVLEVGDRGEFGIWRRDLDRWIEIVPWTRTDAVHPGSEPNEVEVLALGSRLVLAANGTRLAMHEDATLSVGTVGIFVGGDLNEVALERLEIIALS